VSRFQSGSFVFFDVKDAIQLGNPKQIVDSSAGVHKLQPAAVIMNGRMRPDELAESGAVDEIDSAQIQQDETATLLRQFPDGIAEQRRALAERDSANKIGNHCSIHLAGGDLTPLLGAFSHAHALLVEDGARGGSDLRGFGSNND
jgi:hypothetical protein